ncbi:MAG: dihydrodipicolinate synthase family protein [Planctomycetaceae bacterium]
MPFQLIAAPHTPFQHDGRLNTSVVDQQAAYLARHEVAGVFIAGSTGEYASLTTAERMTLAESWADAGARHRLRVIVHVGHNSQSDAVELARHAGTLNVDAIGALAPSYFRPGAIHDLIEFLEPVARAGELPFYFYDIPTMTGVSLPTAELLRIASERLPHLAGVKFTNPDLALFQECRFAAEGRYDILFGCDEQLLAGYALGASGAVGSTYNFIPGVYHELIAAWDAGDPDEARRLQHESVRVVRLLQSFGYMAAAKSVMRLLDVDCGPVRSPLRPLSDEQFRQLEQRLRETGLISRLVS